MHWLWLGFWDLQTGQEINGDAVKSLAESVCQINAVLANFHAYMGKGSNKESWAKCWSCEINNTFKEQSAYGDQSEIFVILVKWKILIRVRNFFWK